MFRKPSNFWSLDEMGMCILQLNGLSKSLGRLQIFDIISIGAEVIRNIMERAKFHQGIRLNTSVEIKPLKEFYIL